MEVSIQEIAFIYKNNIEYKFDELGVLDNFDNIHFIDSTSINWIPSDIYSFINSK